MIVPFSKVSCNGNELKYITEVLASGWLTTAGKTREFEELMADYVGVKYGCAVNSCTAALHLALEAVGVKENEKVFVPDMTFTASAEVVRYLGADPVFLDVEYGTSLITPEILEKGIKENPDVRYLVVVHFGGHPAEMFNDDQNGIVDICKRNNIIIIEDAAHAFPAKIENTFIGGIGDVTCFSFYANKTITTGEGGMLLTNNEQLYERAKTMRLHGINKDVWNRFVSEKPNWEYDVIAPGYKYNMADLNAAIGLAQLERAEELRKERQNIIEIYYDKLKVIECVDLPITKVPYENHAWHLFPIILNEKSPIKRNDLIELLAEKGIGTSVHYKPLHRMSYYKDRYDLKASMFPVAEKKWKGNVTLPLFSGMSWEQTNYVCDTLTELLK